MSPTTQTTKPRVFSLDALHSEGLALAREHFDLVLPTDPEADNWREEAEGLLLRGSNLSEPDIAQAKRLKFISKQGTGLDKVDVEAVKRHGIPLMNTPGVNAQAVAELAFGLIMTVARQTATIDRRIRNGIPVTKADGWKGRSLLGRTIGVIGGGNIGLLVAKMFHGAFGGSVILYDPYLKSRASWDAAIPAEKVSIASDLNDLLSQSDVITIHVPLTNSTRNMIGTPQLRVMKNTAILINTSRGGIINEDELAEALEQGEIFGAGLDAFTIEPPTAKAYPRLSQSDHVVLLPHIGAATEGAQQDTCIAMVQNLVDAFAGRELPNRFC